jgi:excisionase family DNA binding protein
MDEITSPLVSLLNLAKDLNLPQAWLKSEADAGRLPHLRVGKRYRFNRDAVIRTLAERAASGGKGVCRAD